MIYAAYVLETKKGELYKGSTNNLERRIFEHERGYCRSTKAVLPVRLIYVQVCNTVKEARDWEKFFKSGIGREILADVVKWHTR